jgi:hypothetical protein
MTNKFKDILQESLDAIDNGQDQTFCAKIAMGRLENELIRVTAHSLYESGYTGPIDKAELLKL